jgi:hypothetical protein
MHLFQRGLSESWSLLVSNIFTIHYMYMYVDVQEELQRK